MPSSIIIPVANIRPHNRKDLDNLLSSIEPNEWEKIIICFDGCDEEFVEYFQEKYPFIHTIWNELKPLGFSINSNKGLRFCRNELKSGCFLVNQDCILPAAKYLKQVIGEGLSTPESIDNTNLEEINKDRSFIRKVINGKFAFYCPYFSYELLRDVGLLDEDERNVFSDDTFCLKTLLHGKYPIESVDVKIHHKGTHIDSSKPDWESGSGTYTSNDLGLGLQQHRIKWQVPANIPHEEISKWVLQNHQWNDSMVWE